MIGDIMIDTQEYSDNKEEYSKNKIKSYLFPEDHKDCDLIYEVIRDNVDVADNRIEVYNDGDGIDIEMHPEHNVYIPELIFGNMLTSTNYEENEEKVIGGMNGIGAKACNIFSKKFVIETVDSSKGLKYSQTFENNMKKKNKPKIKEYSKYPYTKITFYPDLEKFNISKITTNMYNLMHKRVYDICALTSDNIKVYFNNKKLNVSNFQKYAQLYLEDHSNKDIMYEKVNDRTTVKNIIIIFLILALNVINNYKTYNCKNKTT